MQCYNTTIEGLGCGNWPFTKHSSAVQIQNVRTNHVFESHNRSQYAHLKRLTIVYPLNHNKATNQCPKLPLFWYFTGEFSSGETLDFGEKFHNKVFQNSNHSHTRKTRNADVPFFGHSSPETPANGKQKQSSQNRAERWFKSSLSSSVNLFHIVKKPAI